MKVLIACEYSGIVRDAFIAKGHNAISCDKLPCERGGPHYKGNVLHIINDGFDLMIGHPPCTYLANVQAIHYNEERFPEKTRLRKIKRELAIEFFIKLKNCGIPKIALENPLPQNLVKERIGNYDQIIHPYMFGDPFSKKTCLWLKNLPPLMSTELVSKGEFNVGKNKRTNAKWYHDLSPKDRGRIRSKTFQGIAQAMADQWG